MGQFDSNHTSRYVEKMRVFLNMRKQDFIKIAGLRESPSADNKQVCGRIPRYPTVSVEAIEVLVNQKAASCESSNSLGVRYEIARDYCGLTDAAVARQLSVSRELVRKWRKGINRPQNLEKLATILNVPSQWLASGESYALPANSHLGERVGIEARQYREMLYGRTFDLLAQVSDELSTEEIQLFIEKQVMSVLSETARRAGGRWQFLGGCLYFCPWFPLKHTGLTRRYWSDEVEVIILEELVSNRSVYAAWHALKKRCEDNGWQYPKLISLHKRIEKQRKWVEKFGLEFKLPEGNILI